MTNYQDETHWQNIFYCWAVKWYTNYILQYQTYLELEDGDDGSVHQYN
jgi:hypothetical protein